MSVRTKYLTSHGTRISGPWRYCQAYSRPVNSHRGVGHRLSMTELLRARLAPLMRLKHVVIESKYLPMSFSVASRNSAFVLSQLRLTISASRLPSELEF